MGTGVLHLDLLGAEIAIEVTRDGCIGVIAGGIAAADVERQIMSGIATTSQQAVANDAGCPAACGGQARDLLNIFDSNDDDVIAVEEVASSALISALLAPDLDLLDAAGNPGSDGRNDALSMCVGVSRARATFASP